MRAANLILVAGPAAPLRKQRPSEPIRGKPLEVGNQRATPRVWVNLVGGKQAIQLDPTVDEPGGIAEARKRVPGRTTGPPAVAAVEDRQLNDIVDVEPVISTSRTETGVPRRYGTLAGGDLNAADRDPHAAGNVCATAAARLPVCFENAAGAVVWEPHLGPLGRQSPAVFRSQPLALFDTAVLRELRRKDVHPATRMGGQ